MNNTPPIFQQLLNSICPPAAQLDAWHKKASDRRFAKDPVRITAMCPLDDGIDDRSDEERAEDARDVAAEWKADHQRDVGGAS